MDLLVIFGPPAVGKMTVGREVVSRTPGWRLVHNHLTIEPLLEVFGYGTAPFTRLLEEFRWRILQEAILALPGLVVTFVWDLADPADTAYLQRYVDAVEADGGRVRFVELVAPLPVRQARNNTELRLAAKASKRDRAFNDANLLSLERHRLTTDPAAPTPADALLARHPHLRLDNTDLSAADAAERILGWLQEPGRGR